MNDFCIICHKRRDIIDLQEMGLVRKFGAVLGLLSLEPKMTVKVVVPAPEMIHYYSLGQCTVKGYEQLLS